MDLLQYYRSFSEDNIPDNLKLMLFRIIQEQINNIIRHAAATTIHIRLQLDAESLELNITDNGQGFDPAINEKKVLDSLILSTGWDCSMAS